LAATIGQGVPEVKLHLQPVQSGIYPSTMHAIEDQNGLRNIIEDQRRI
jgi:hypothetical protein